MNPIKKDKWIIWLILIIVFLQPIDIDLLANNEYAKSDSLLLTTTSSSKIIHIFDYIENWANWLIKGFQYFISDIDDHNCPMEPSCSRYGAMAVNKHGIIVGSLMISDRLNRCGHDLSYYKIIYKNGRLINEDIP